MATWSVTTEIRTAREAGFTPEFIKAEIVSTLCEDGDTDTWFVSGKKDFQTLTDWVSTLGINTFTKHEGEWVILGLNLQVGEVVTVTRKNGTRSEVVVTAILGTRAGKTLASFENVEPATPARPARTVRPARRGPGGGARVTRTYYEGGHLVTVYSNGCREFDGMQLWDED